MTAREEKPPTIARRSPEGATEDAPDSPEEHRAGATAPGTPGSLLLQRGGRRGFHPSDKAEVDTGSLQEGRMSARTSKPPAGAQGAAGLGGAGACGLSPPAPARGPPGRGRGRGPRSEAGRDEDR